VGNTLGRVVGDVVGSTVEGNTLGSNEGALLGADDGHKPHVILHVWKTPFTEHLS